jgi:hypothetical protein
LSFKNLGIISEGEKLVKINAKTNKPINHLETGFGCITNQIATPTNAII